MKVYLVRHGDAVEKEIDPQNPLSELGQIKVKSIGELLASMDLQVSAIYHSEKLRAEQTATLLAQAIHYEGKVEKRSGLHPLDLVSPIASEINQANTDLMYVGHMPFMGKLVAKLLTGSEANEVVLFQTATVACLEKMGSDVWILRWLLSPDLVL